MQVLGKHKLVRAFAYMGASNVFMLLIGLATSVVMARLLNPREFGILLAGEAFVTVFSSLFTLGFRNTMFSVAAKHELGFKEGLNSAIGTGLLIKTLSLIPTVAIVYFAALWMKPSADELYVICSYIFIESMSSFAKLFGAVRRALGEFKLISIVTSTNKILRLIMIFVVLKYFGGWKLLVTLFAIFSIFKFLISYISTISLFKPCIDTKQIIPILKDSLGFGLFDTLDDAQARFDRVILNYFLGPASVAFYSIPARLNRLTKILPQTINQVFLPTLHQVYENTESRFLSLSQHISRLFALSGALTFIAVYYFSAFFIIKLFGEQYRESLVLVDLFAYATLLLFLDKAPNLVLAVRADHIKRIGSLLGSTTIFIALCFVLIPAYGIAGAVCASIIASAAKVVFLGFFVHKEISLLHSLFIVTPPMLAAPWVPVWVLVPAYSAYLYFTKLVGAEDFRLLRDSFRSRR